MGAPDQSAVRRMGAVPFMILRCPNKASLSCTSALRCGYQGSAKLPDKRRPPKKRAPQVQRTKAEKRANRALAQRRSVVEHVMRRLQILRILLER